MLNQIHLEFLKVKKAPTNNAEEFLLHNQKIQDLAYILHSLARKDFLIKVGEETRKNYEDLMAIALKLAHKDVECIIAQGQLVISLKASKKVQKHPLVAPRDLARLINSSLPDQDLDLLELFCAYVPSFMALNLAYQSSKKL